MTMALDKFEQGKYPLTGSGSFRFGSHRGHAFCLQFVKYRGVTIYVKNAEDNIESFRSQGYHDITELEQMAKNKIDLFLKKQEQQRLRREALNDFTSRCKEYRPGGYCHKHPPYKCAICRCHPKHEFLWDYDERHGLMHTFG